MLDAGGVKVVLLVWDWSVTSLALPLLAHLKRGNLPPGELLL